MKRFSISCIILLFALSGISQCLPQGINFTTQSQIDSFPINYPNCTQIIGNVHIGGVYLCDISNLNGLSNIISIGGSFGITVTYFLIDLSGLDLLKSIGGGFYIQSNQSLTSFSGMDSLRYIGGALDIYSNNRIVNLSGFDGVEIIKDYVEIRFNDSLSSLSGLDHINADSITGLFVTYNPLLSNCAVQSVCDFLNLPNPHVHFNGNLSGCNSEIEVDNACAGLYVNGIKNGNEFSIYPNPASNIVNIETHSTFKDCNLSIINVSGQEIIHTRLKEQIHFLDIGSLQQGIYFVRIAYQNGVANLKFIKN